VVHRSSTTARRPLDAGPPATFLIKTEGVCRPPTTARLVTPVVDDRGVTVVGGRQRPLMRTCPLCVSARYEAAGAGVRFGLPRRARRRRCRDPTRPVITASRCSAGWTWTSPPLTRARSTRQRLHDKPLPNDETALTDVLARLAEHGWVLVIVDQPASIGALAVAVARPLGIEVTYLPGLAMRRIADLHPGQGKTDARDAYVIADAARTMPPCPASGRHRRRDPRRTLRRGWGRRGERAQGKCRRRPPPRARRCRHPPHSPVSEDAAGLTRPPRPRQPGR
jgi:hypothetical protein